MEKSRDLFTKAHAFEEADIVKAKGIYPFFRPIQATEGSSVQVDGVRRVMIGSNNYLGLTHDPRVQEAAKKAIEQYGTGCTGSRFLNGNLEIHQELEKELAQFLGREDCLVMTTGFLSNLSAISTLCGRKDVIYSDRENHASIVSAQQLSSAKTLKFRHNDFRDLERVLEMTRDNFEGALIVADGVFSMSGDILKLPEFVKLAKKYDCRLYVDDAHALGVLGPEGQGTSHHFGVQKDVDLVMATFSKSFASLGGYVAGDHKVIDYLRHVARPFMFSAAVPPPSVATALKCLEIVKNEPQHLHRLRKNALKMSAGFNQLGFNTLNSQTPVIPVLIGEDHEAFAFSQLLFEHGVFTTPVVSPAVPKGCALIRTSYMATHTEEDLDYVLEIFEKLGKEFGIIGQTETQDRLAELAYSHFGVEASLG